MTIWLESESNYVLVGGSWFDDPQYARQFHRDDCTPGIAYYDFSFRLMRRVS